MRQWCVRVYRQFPGDGAMLACFIEPGETAQTVKRALIAEGWPEGWFEVTLIADKAQLRARADYWRELRQACDDLVERRRAAKAQAAE